MLGKRYIVKEIFYSLQGEGMRAGEASVFVRFAGCNLNCRKETHGFDCDTDFKGGVKLTAEGVLEAIKNVNEHCRWIVLTGGEPAVQLDSALVSVLKAAGYSLAIETNGTKALPEGLDWISVSPKPGTCLEQTRAMEVKYVLRAGDLLPTRSEIKAAYYLLSPAFEGNTLPQDNLRHCINLCLGNPKWILSVQLHKLIGVR